MICLEAAVNARTLTLLVAASAAACSTPGCSDGITSPPYDPELPTEWAPAITNPYLPLLVGSTWRYLGESDGETEEIVVEVLPQTRLVNGVVATVVRDRVYVDGELVEDTYDWFAQDAAGNVWYLGEDSKEVENGEVVGTEGSWEWGVGGALPGIVMWADPAAHIGEEYRQEYDPGEAEDWGEVVAVDVSVAVPFGSFSGCVRTEDWNALEGGGRETKTYCPAIGTVLELAPGGERVELVEFTGPNGAALGARRR